MSNATIQEIVTILRDSTNIVEAAKALEDLLGYGQVTGLEWRDNEDMRTVIVGHDRISPYTHAHA